MYDGCWERTQKLYHNLYEYLIYKESVNYKRLRLRNNVVKMQIDLIPSLRRGWVSDYSFESELLNASAHQQL